MTKLKIAILAAVLSATAVPAFAQEPLAQSAVARTHTQRHVHRAATQAFMQANNAYLGNADPFWPGNVATPGDSYDTGEVPARATPLTDPYGFSGYAGDNYYGAGYNNGRFSNRYAQRNNFACFPGSSYMGDDGRGHVCQ